MQFGLKWAFNLPRELSEDEILEIIKKFAVSAKLAKEVGFTGVQIHGAHGYLVSQFLSTRHNQRNDRWGGSLENRMRFVCEIYYAIRKEVGEDYPISIKLNSGDFIKGGLSEDESEGKEPDVNFSVWIAVWKKFLRIGLVTFKKRRA